MSIDLSSMRHRPGGVQQTINTHMGYEWTQSTNPALTPYERLASYSNSDMYDVVVKDFYKRSKQGEIFNNPMQKTSVVFKQRPGTNTGWLKQVRTSDGKEIAFWRINSSVATTLPKAQAKRTLAHPERIENVAITAAYAGVTANKQNAVLWAGEARETVKMLGDIGAGLLALYKRTKKQRAAWAKGKLTVSEAQSLTLGLLYGLLPLEQSIAQVMEGLFELKTNQTRETSRGFDVYTDTNNVNIDDRNVASGLHTTSQFSETLSVTVRAGVLYDIDVDELPAVTIIADPKQIVETAYALARLSFVIDWFINVGNTLKAWSPSSGTKVLAAFLSVEEEYVQKYSKSTVWFPREAAGTTETVNCSGSYDYELKTTKKTRVPISRADLAIIPRIDINLDLDKIFALVLLFAKAKR